MLKAVKLVYYNVLVLALLNAGCVKRNGVLYIWYKTLYQSSLSS